MDDTERLVAGPAQFKALGHPVRQRILSTLDGRESTLRDLSVALDAVRGTIAYHLRVLREAGLVEVVRTRRVQGGVEQYYGKTASRTHVPLAVAEAAPQLASNVIAGVAAEMAASGAAPRMLALRHARLTVEQVEAIARILHDATTPEALPDSGDEGRRYGIAVTVYPAP
ncbi:ArsR/SmtB family transcription factor [Longispora urticae]